MMGLMDGTFAVAARLIVLAVMGLAGFVGLAVAAPSSAQRNETKGGPSSPLSVMTFNIRYGTANDGEDHWEKRRDQLIGLLREHQADVIGVQEALHFQLQEILKALPDYRMVGIGRSDGKTAGEYSAILYRASRLTVTASDTFWFSDTPSVVASKSWGNNIERICTWARFEDKQGRAFYLFNLHLDHQSQPSREKSVLLLRERIAGRERAGDPVIVTGDFNAGETNPALAAMRGDSGAQGSGAAATRYIDTFRAMHPDDTEVGTFNGFKPGNTKGEKIDHIFVEPATKVLAAAIVRTSRDGHYPSDHFPVTAQIQFSR